MVNYTQCWRIFLSVFDHFVKLALKGLKSFCLQFRKFSNKMRSQKEIPSELLVYFKVLQFLLELFYGNIINRLFKPEVLFLFYLGRGDSFTRYVFLMNKHFLKNWYGILTYLLINSVSIKLFYRKNSSYMPWSRPFSDGQNPVPPNKNLLVLFDEVFLSLCHFVFFSVYVIYRVLLQCSLFRWYFFSYFCI